MPASKKPTRPEKRQRRHPITGELHEAIFHVVGDDVKEADVAREATASHASTLDGELKLPEPSLFAGMIETEADTEILKLLAADPEIDAHMAGTLAAGPLPNIRRAVIANPNAPADIIAAAAASGDDRERASAAANPSIDAGTLAKLAADESWEAVSYTHLTLPTTPYV